MDTVVHVVPISIWPRPVVISVDSSKMVHEAPGDTLYWMAEVWTPTGKTTVRVKSRTRPDSVSATTLPARLDTFVLRTDTRKETTNTDTKTIEPTAWEKVEMSIGRWLIVALLAIAAILGVKYLLLPILKARGFLP
jgi:hypothetical protein